MEELIGVVNHKYADTAYIEFDDASPSIKIKAKDLNQALHKDRVKIEINLHKVRVIEILERNQLKFIKGKLSVKNKIVFLKPIESHYFNDFYIPEEYHIAGIYDNDWATIDFISWNAGEKNPVGRIISLDGNEITPQLATQFLKDEMKLKYEFPYSVLKEAKKLTLSDDLFQNRKDFRNLFTITIDPVNAKDHDDAISIDKIDTGYRLGVHIADVSAFVTPGSSIDLEAFERGCSIYLKDEHIPMLPEELSSDLCSLIPNVDRLTFSIIYDLDEDLNINGYWIGKGIINSNANIDYSEAQDILNDPGHEYYENLKKLEEITDKLSILKESIEFDSSEIEFVLDKNNYPIKINSKKRYKTHKIIETFMLLANQTVAEMLSKHGAGIYRAHPKPSDLQIMEMYKSLKNMDIEFNVSEDIRKNIQNIKNTTPEDVLNSVKNIIIRNLPKAYYTSDENIGHYGLGFKFYTHFTSPIRRYPDIIAHRILNCIINENKFIISDLDTKAIILSNCEKVAQESERESVSEMMCFFMKNVDYIFPARIVNIKEFGFYVQTEWNADGFININKIKGAKIKNNIVKTPKHNLKINDWISVKIDHIDIIKRRIYFTYIDRII